MRFLTQILLLNKSFFFQPLFTGIFLSEYPSTVRNSSHKSSMNVERLKDFKGKDLALFIVMLIGVVGTVLIEQQLHNSNRAEIKIPVLIDDTRKRR